MFIIKKHIKPGLTEIYIQNMLMKMFVEQNIYPVVLMVGCDQKPLNNRHFISTDNKLQNRLTIIACLRRKGLIISTTKDIYVNEISQKECQQHDLVSSILDEFIAGTRKGRTYKELFNIGRKLYKKYNISSEFEKHPIGGPTGYEIRYEMIDEQSSGIFKNNQVVALNPTITGYKAEGTFLITDHGCESLTK